MGSSFGATGGVALAASNGSAYDLRLGDNPGPGRIAQAPFPIRTRGPVRLRFYLALRSMPREDIESVLWMYRPGASDLIITTYVDGRWEAREGTRLDAEERGRGALLGQVPVRNFLALWVQDPETWEVARGRDATVTDIEGGRRPAS